MGKLNPQFGTVFWHGFFIFSALFPYRNLRFKFTLFYIFVLFSVTEMLGAAGPEIMYCGDHLYADVVRQEVLMACMVAFLLYSNSASIGTEV